jgi:modification methylase
VRPYYSDDFATIYHGDNAEVLDALPRGDVGVVLTSPPYNIGGAGSAGTYFKALATGYEDHDDDMPPEEYREWQQSLLRALWALLSDDGAIFYNHKPRAKGNACWLPLSLVPEDMPIRQVITWDRGSGFQRQFTHFVPAYEWVLLIAKEAFRLTTRSVDDVWRIPFETGGEHPAPFPLKLATTAIGSTSAQLVLDPFMGSGTTLRAAKDLGRRCIGIEKSERYCEIAAKRLGQEVLDFGGAA